MQDTRQNRERFSTLLLSAVELLGRGKPLSASAQDLYFKALARFEFQEIERALFQALGLCKWMPTPAELVEIITAGASQITLEERGQTEADKVTQAIREHGAYNSVAFDDPVTMAVIAGAFSGWIQLCQELREDQVKWFQKDFVRAYCAYARSKITRHGHLAGISEMHNEAHAMDGFVPRPRLVGDPTNAQAVLERGVEVQALDTAEGEAADPGYVAKQLAEKQARFKESLDKAAEIEAQREGGVVLPLSERARLQSLTEEERRKAVEASLRLARKNKLREDAEAGVGHE